jgi:NADPH-dependent 2,4-dienoyl-CoA reductase/sulfur reductase-like enzyme/nitrite reductase/ring-hydroxylating ferredoxin subunit
LKDKAGTRQTKPKVPAERIRSSPSQAQRPVLDQITKGEGTMAESQNRPDLVKGIALLDLPDGGKLVGDCGDEQVLLVRRGTEVFAVSPTCTHYGGPLADGLVVDDTVRCPWHHACFDLRTGEALRAPAFRPLACWSVEQRDGKIFVGEKRKRVTPEARDEDPTRAPDKIVIVGGGAAGFAAAEKLRRERYQGSIVMLSDDKAPPVDRPNLSKDYLAGKAPEDWLPLRGESFYSKNEIDLRLVTNAAGIDTGSGEIVLADGSRIPYDRLLLATGAEPVRLTIPGADQPHVHTLRTLADCRAIIASAKTARRAVVLGASFIGLEVAAALRARDVEVHVVAPGKRPMERILGPQMGDFIRTLHEENGVVFHMENKANSIDGETVKFDGGGTLTADFVVAGIGVRPRTALAETAGLILDRGVTVNAFLETSVPGIFAAGDIARWPDPHTGENIRVEHWVVAERQGQTAALNMLGRREKYADVPFFWSQHYDVSINYVGHAEQWDAVEIEGDIAARDCLLRFKLNGRTLAVASIFRDIESLEAEVAMEHQRAV